MQENHDEGVEILDEKLKAKQEEEKALIKEMNDKMKNILTLLQEMNVKARITAYSEQLDMSGIWVTEGMNELEKKGLTLI